MTMPDERTRSVLHTRSFLRKVASSREGYKRIPKAVRVYAAMLLRHYPFPYELLEADAWDEDTIREYHRER